MTNKKRNWLIWTLWGLIIMAILSIASDIEIYERSMICNVSQIPKVNASGFWACAEDLIGNGTGTGNTTSQWNSTGNYVYLNNTDANVGIGVLTPIHKLVVNGNVNITGDISQLGNITFSNGLQIFHFNNCTEIGFNVDGSDC